MKKLVLFLLLASSTLFAQQYDWGTNKPEAEKQWKYLNIKYNSNLYDQCLPELTYLLQNTPKLHSNLYLIGANIYESLEQKETDAARKVVLQDSAIELYSAKMKLFGDSAGTMNRMGYIYYSYKSTRSSASDLYSFYKKIIKLNGLESFDVCYLYYFYSAALAKNSKLLTDEELYAVFDEVNAAFDVHLKATPDQATYINQYKVDIKNYLDQVAPLDCERIKSILVPKYRETPQDEVLTEKLFGLLQNGKCVKDALWLELAEKMADKKKDAVLYQEIGDEYTLDKKYSKAVIYYKKAVEVSSDQSQNSAVFYKLAQIANVQGQKAEARQYARTCIAQSYKTKECYNMIGDLYLGAYADCKTDDEIQSLGIFILAYQMYEKAGSTSQMAQARKSFPTAEAIFLANRKIGDLITVGGWVNESVKLEKK